MFSTRFRFIARLATRLVRTLEWLPAGSERGTALVAGLVAPGGMEGTLDETRWTWWPTGSAFAAVGITTCRRCPKPAMLLTDQFEPLCARCWVRDCELDALAEEYKNHRDADEHLGGPEPEDEYNTAICPDCGHDYYHDAQGRCMYPMGVGDESRVCGWHPNVMGPVACPTRVETRESLEAGRLCYAGRCSRCHGEGCPEFWVGFKKAEQEHIQAIRDHDCEVAGCGPVCTAFES